LWRRIPLLADPAEGTIQRRGRLESTMTDSRHLLNRADVLGEDFDFVDLIVNHALQRDVVLLAEFVTEIVGCDNRFGSGCA
jgi:hypothetical protein